VVKTVTTKAKDAIADAAQRSAKGVKSVAGEALGAAAKAAAQIVLESTANALEAGRARIRRSTPAMKQAAGKAATEAVSRPARRKAVAKKRKTTGRHKRKTGRESRR
jgi:hypothetical protein